MSTGSSNADRGGWRCDPAALRSATSSAADMSSTRCGDAQAADDLPAVSTASLPMLSTALITCSTADVASASGVAHGDDAQGPHLVDQLADLALQLLHLVGHVGVVEEQGGVGQVDHQLARVLGLGQHLPEIA
ncbi:MAG: hypothetical protein R2761_23190 [Acidimicrobiales bacterium]